MPYTSKSGKAVPDFLVKPEAHKWIHGDPKTCKLCAPCAPCVPFCMQCKSCKCCDPCTQPCKAKCEPHCKTCELKCKDICNPICGKCPPFCLTCGLACMKCKCNPECIKLCDGICIKCRGPCGPVCGGCRKCDSLCEIGPACQCKTVGCELTCGIKALEDNCGVWHVATDMFPKPLPAIAYPMCLPGSGPCCPGGKDEEKKGDDFSIGGPTETESVKILRYACGCVSPFEMLKKSVLGLMLDPPFDGNPPKWYQAEPGGNAVHAEPETEGKPEEGKAEVPIEVVSATNFGEPCCKTRLPPQLEM